MNTGILLTSFNYLRTFVSVVSLSKCIYKNLKLKLYSDFKFRSAVIKQHIEIVDHLSKYIIHRNMILDLKQLYESYDLLCILYKKAKLSIVSDPFKLINDVKNYKNIRNNVVQFVTDNFSSDDISEATIYLIYEFFPYIEDVVTIKKILSIGIKTIKILYCGYTTRRIELDNYAVVRFICERGIAEEIDIIFGYIIKHEVYIGIDIISEYTDHISTDNMRQIIIRQMFNYILNKQFKLQCRADLLHIAIYYDNHEYVRFAFSKIVNIKRSLILNSIRSFEIIDTLKDVGFSFESPDDDAVISFMLSNHELLLNKIIREGVTINKQETLLFSLRHSYTKFKIIWNHINITIDPEVLLTAIRMGKEAHVNNLLQRGIYHKDMLDVALKFPSKRIIYLTRKFLK